MQHHAISTQQLQTAQRARLLIVDDEQINVSTLVNLLKDDYELILATNAEQALARLRHNASAPDLILLDIVMPGMDGYALCREIRNDTRYANIPIIFISALESELDETKGFELGASDFIRKPFRPQVVKARIRTQLEFKRRGDLLEQLALEDPLTGLANRRRLDNYLRDQWHMSRRKGSLLSIALCDVDHFKLYNDHYGHGAGDDCLRQVARAIQSCQRRASDLCARYGGEEFMLVLPDTDDEGARLFCEQTQQAVAALNLEHAASPDEHRVCLSIGVATLRPVDTFGLNDFIEKADAALYQAKQNGRNCICSATDTTGDYEA
ncbi:MAG: diguanylate cyclase [Oleiphilaceae bacterium]|nr:diguanylate cyclase [Oleiphilaceae bacterium]